jgi:hypothetical protein
VPHSAAWSLTASVEPLTSGGVTWSYQPSESSYATTTAVDAQSLQPSCLWLGLEDCGDALARDEPLLHDRVDRSHHGSHLVEAVSYRPGAQQGLKVGDRLRSR